MAVLSLCTHEDVGGELVFSAQADKNRVTNIKISIYRTEDLSMVYQEPITDDKEEYFAVYRGYIYPIS